MNGDENLYRIKLFLILGNWDEDSPEFDLRIPDFL